MKSLFDEYYKVVMYTIFGLMIVMSSYCIILNVHRYKAVNEKIVVSDIDIDYKEYVDNINKIEDKLSNIKDEIVVNAISKTLNSMKQSGVFRLVPKTKLGYHDLYDLNEFFIEKLINEGWVIYLKPLNLDEIYTNTFNMLISNANYINSVLGDNGVVIYESKNESKIIDDYHYILGNYVLYSKALLNICDSIGGYHD